MRWKIFSSGEITIDPAKLNFSFHSKTGIGIGCTPAQGSRWKYVQQKNRSGWWYKCMMHLSRGTVRLLKSASANYEQLWYLPPDIYVGLKLLGFLWFCQLVFSLGAFTLYCAFCSISTIEMTKLRIFYFILFTVNFPQKCKFLSLCMCRTAQGNQYLNWPLEKIKEAAEDFVRSIFLSILVFHLLITDSPKILKKFERILWNSFIDPCIHFIGVKIYSV